MPPRPRGRTRPRDSGWEAPAWLLRLIAPAVALALSLPGFQLTYLWDDYAFLANWREALKPWTPDPFYRPLPRGLVFGLLNQLGPGGELVAHAINAALLALAIWLLEDVTTRLAGRRAGFYAALAFATLGAVGQLVGWASFVQELLAIVFVLAALRLELAGRTAWALVAAAAGLLSKETVALSLPVIALVRWIARGSREGLWRRVSAFAALGAAWALFHPGLRTLLARGLRSGATSYVGLEHSGRWGPYLGQYLLTLINLPISGLASPWPGNRNGVTFLALAVLVTGFAVYARGRGGREAGRGEEGPVSMVRLAALAALLALPPLLVTATMVRYWSPYFAVPAALGSSMVLGAVLSRRPAATAGLALAFFLVMGVWCRGLDNTSLGWTERGLEASSGLMRGLEAEFRALHPTFPPGSQLLISTQVRSSLGVYTMLHEYQAPRFWYRDPSLLVQHPWEREPGRAHEFLFVIPPDQGLVEIDTTTLQPANPVVGLSPQPLETAVRTYATGLFQSGEPSRAIDILFRAPSTDAAIASVHGRIAVALLLALGRGTEARQVLTRVPPMPRDYAIQTLRVLLLEPLRRHPIEPYLLQAFGVGDDAAARKELEEWVRANSLPDVAERLQGAQTTP
jgi:hypothetical protein